MSHQDFRPRRSFLYMPGANARALEKAKTIDVDGLLLDLEDAVAPEAKEVARDQVVGVVRDRPYGSREVVVRINALSTPWGEADLKAAVGAGPDGVLAPKVDNAEDVASLDKQLTAAGAAAELGLWVMIETPLAILNLAEIAGQALTTRLKGFVLGTNDLAKDTRAQMTAGREAFQFALAKAVTAARAYGLVAIDGVFNDIKDENGFEAECQQGRVLGFDGKSLIHPAQVATCNALFAPRADEVNQARAIVDAFADPVNAGQGVLKVNGKMTERLHLEEAQRTLAMAEAIAARSAD